MLEKRKQGQEKVGGGDGGTPFGPMSPKQAGSALVTNGPYSETLPVAGMTVGEIRMKYSDRLDIDPGSTAIVSGVEVDNNTKIAIGQALMFVKKAGEKGDA
jgi:hypothetical protein